MGLAEELEAHIGRTVAGDPLALAFSTGEEDEAKHLLGNTPEANLTAALALLSSVLAAHREAILRIASDIDAINARNAAADSAAEPCVPPAD